MGFAPIVHNNPFRNKYNKPLMSSLFIEETQIGYDYILYTLEAEDKEFQGKTYPSIYRLYMEMEDLTEFEFATAYFENYAHWEALCKAEWFIPYVSQWRKELDLKIKAQALKKIRAIANTPSPNTFQANKILIERSWEKNTPQAPKGKGRPPKEITKEDEVADMKRIQEDWERLNNNEFE